MQGSAGCKCQSEGWLGHPPAHRGLLKKTAFEPSYTALTKDGAEWIVANTSLKFVGIDYLSLAPFADQVGAHVPLLQQVPGLPLGLTSMHPSVLHSAWLSSFEHHADIQSAEASMQSGSDCRVTSSQWRGCCWITWRRGCTPCTAYR
jgi:hypothetical protein